MKKLVLVFLLSPLSLLANGNTTSSTQMNNIQDEGCFYVTGQVTCSNGFGSYYSTACHATIAEAFNDADEMEALICSTAP